ncbi:MAG: flagellar export chaperone FlgN [Thermotaleaceae bacterium]
MDSRERIEILLELTNQKIARLEELLKLTVLQGNRIKAGDLEEVSSLIQRKQDLMNLINSLDSRFLEQYTLLKKSLHIQSFEEINPKEYPMAASLQQNVGQIMTLLKKIEEIDRQNHVQLRQDFEQVKEEMKKNKAEQQSNKILANYGNKYSNVQGVFIDNKDRK